MIIALSAYEEGKVTLSADEFDNDKEMEISIWIGDQITSVYLSPSEANTMQKTIRDYLTAIKESLL